MEKDILHLKINALMDILNSKGLITEGELEVINKSLVDTLKATGHDSDEEIEKYLF